MPVKDDQLGGIALIAGAVGGLVTMSLHPTGHDLSAPGQFASAAFRAAAVHALAIARDRKSTRLNSSHVAISYAVFCLKKKKCSGCAASSTTSQHASVYRA